MRQEMLNEKTLKEVETVRDQINQAWGTLYRLRVELGIETDFDNELSKLCDKLNGLAVDTYNIQDQIKKERFEQATNEVMDILGL